VFADSSSGVGVVRVGRVGVCVLVSVVVCLRGSTSEVGRWFGVDYIGGGGAMAGGSLSVGSRVNFSSLYMTSHTQSLTRRRCLSWRGSRWTLPRRTNA
jgi:hypothetical protein